MRSAAGSGQNCALFTAMTALKVASGQGSEDTLLVRSSAPGLWVKSRHPVISPAGVTRLFQPFHRLTAASNGDAGERGTGLGLSIVQAIATAHRAALTAYLQPGGGLTVQVSFPAPQAPQADRGGPE